MQRALVLAAVTVLAVARPETYKEKEDFQYSRSSSDDGTKSGFYGAQRGNMGGNYERAHNMDLLAQHQMGGLVRTVEGELGDGAKQKSGSVFSAANSRGVYGSERYDLSNVEGRNFQEGTSLGDSQSHSSLSSHNSGYGSQAYSAANSAYGSNSHNSRYNGYHTTGHSDQALYANNMQGSDNLQSASQYDGSQAAQDSRYYSQSGYQGQSTYDQAAANSHLSNAYGSNNRFLSARPVRVYVRPGGTVTIPVAAQTYDASQGSASTFVDRNSLNSEAEVSGTNDQQSAYKPRHYESSYSYRKEWEKHDTKPVAGVPLAVPTVNPYPSNSELYEDTQAQGSEHQQETSRQEAQNAHSTHSSQYRGQIKSGSLSQSRHQAAYNAHMHSAASDTAAASNVADSSVYTHGAYNHGASANLNAANLNNQVEEFGSKPKSYQSSYSYHKSWERQGDPYVIKPSTNGLYPTADIQASQKLTASSLNQGASGSHQYGAHYHQGHQGYSSSGVDSDCDENGHIRVARSVGHDQYPYQQSQNIYEGQEDLGQQSHNFEDISQQSQNLEDLGQQSQKLEDLGQQSQKLEDLGQQSQNLQDFGQQSQNLEDFGQQSQNLEDFGQQSQKLDDFGQQSQKLEDFGQQTQSQVQDVGQETQSKWDNLEQGQTPNQFDRIEDLGQKTQNQWDQQSQTDLGQQTQNTWSTLETIQNENGGKDGVEHTSHSHYGMNTAFQTQENVFEINYPSDINKLHQSESHITQGNGELNPFAHAVFDQHSQHEEKIELNQSDTNKHFTQKDQFENMGYPWMFNPNNNFQHYGYGSSLNSYTNTQTHYTRNDHSTDTFRDIHLNPSKPGSTSLTSLWDLIDDIEKQTTSADGTNSFDSDHSIQENTENVQTNGNSDSTQNFNEYSFNIDSKPVHPIAFLPSTTETSNIEKTTVKQNTLHPHYVERGDIEPEKNLEPQEDVGRGDIGPEVSSSDKSNAPNKPLEIFEINPVSSNSKPYKTPEEIETLSLTKETNKPTFSNAHSTDEHTQNNVQNDDKKLESDFSVLSLNDQKRFDHHIEQDNWKLQSDIQKTSSTTPKSSYHQANPNYNAEQGPKDIEQQNTHTRFETSRQAENLNQQNYNQFESLDQQIVDLNQQTENLRQELQIKNFDEQNLDHHGSNTEHGPDEIQQQNLNQQFETLGQQTENLNQESFNQFRDLDQQTVNLGQEHQQFEDLGQQSEGFQQENINDFKQHEQFQQESLTEYEQQNVNLNQPQKEQQLENWGQQNENLDQQSQTEDLWKPSEDLQPFVPPSAYHKEGREQHHSEPIVEPKIVTQKSTSIDAPPEPVTENVGFWNKVGSKFNNAKNKVSSWFSRS